MSNHVHILLQPIDPDLSSAVHVFAFRYAQYYNKKYKRRGHLYQGRFKAIKIQGGLYLKRLVRYIHLNPVRAGIVQNPGDYPWSSHLAYQQDAEYSWLTKDLVLGEFGGNEREGRAKLLEYTLMDDLEAKAETLQIQKSFRYGVYGDDEFLLEFQKEHGIESLKFYSESNLQAVIKLPELITTVCEHFDVTLNDLKSRDRRQHLVDARTSIAFLAKQLKIASLSELGNVISRDRTSLSRLALKGGRDKKNKQLLEELQS